MKLNKAETSVVYEITVDGIQVGQADVKLECKEITALVIYEPYQDKGYGTQALRMLVDQGYDNIWMRHHSNSKAIHVFEKCGFRFAHDNAIGESLVKMYVRKTESEDK